jgi:hypothetical protein
VSGFSLYEVGRGATWQARSATVKGVVMSRFGIAVLVEAMLKTVRGSVPAADVMTAVGSMALGANAFCLVPRSGS